jgi:hypothetical protein
MGTSKKVKRVARPLNRVEALLVAGSPKIKALPTREGDSLGTSAHGLGSFSLWHAVQADGERLKTEQELLELGRGWKRRTEFVKGEPMWLWEAKRAYAELGTSIALLSFEHDLECADFERLSEELRASVEKTVRKFYKVMRGRDVVTARLYYLCRSVDLVYRKAGPAVEALEAARHVQSPHPNGFAAVALFLLCEQALDRDARIRAVPLAEQLVELWPVEKRTKGPSKWDVCSSLWTVLTGEETKPSVVRDVWRPRASRRIGG